jgi:LCP family protein required for cell wall assembly
MKNLFKKPFTAGKIIKLILLILLAALVCVVGYYAYFALINPSASFDTSIPTPEPTQALTPNPETGETPVPEVTQDPNEALLSQADLEFMKDRVNVLVLGMDMSTERIGVRETFRTDVMMLFSVDFANKKVDIISVPRDSYASIYNVTAKYKINGAFMLGGGLEGDGFNYAMKTVSNLLGGIPINYYACVDMEGLKDLVNAMGGVNYDVDIEIKLNGRVLKTGYQHLDGQQVLDYCRARKGISTDIGRTDRQQRMLIEVVKQLKSSAQLANIVNIYNSVKDKIYTNLDVRQIAALGVLAMQVDLENDITRQTLEGEYDTVYGVKFYLLDQKKKVALVKTIFGISINPQREYDINYALADSAGQDGTELITKTQEYMATGKILSADSITLNNLITALRQAIEDFTACTDDYIDDAYVENIKEASEALTKAVETAKTNYQNSLTATPTPNSGGSTSPGMQIG